MNVDTESDSKELLEEGDAAPKQSKQCRLKRYIGLAVFFVTAVALSYFAFTSRTARPAALDGKLIKELFEESEEDFSFAPAATDCNCDLKRLVEKPHQDLDSCWSLCKSDSDCKSFAIWTAEGNDAGYCATYGKACPENGQCPKREGNGWYNMVFNKKQNSEYVEVEANCNCDEERLVEKPHQDLDSCWSLCKSDSDCKSFAIWTEEGDDAGYCATYGTACRLNGECPKREGHGWYNIAYNRKQGVEYMEVETNCNCDTKRLVEKPHQDLDSCWSLCKSDSDCKSFAIWTEEGNDAGYCATYGKACTGDGRCPKHEGHGWYNIAYNRE